MRRTEDCPGRVAPREYAAGEGPRRRRWQVTFTGDCASRITSRTVPRELPSRQIPRANNQFRETRSALQTTPAGGVLLQGDGRQGRGFTCALMTGSRSWRVASKQESQSSRHNWSSLSRGNSGGIHGTRKKPGARAAREREFRDELPARSSEFPLNC